MPLRRKPRFDSEARETSQGDLPPSESRRSDALLRFGTYEVDLRAGELRKSGVKIKIQEKPFQILVVLLERPGEVVTREELHRRLWPPDTFVDFDGSLNAATNKLREALGDSADNPRFVETLPRRGYRFIAPVEKPVQAAAVGSGISYGETPSPQGGAVPFANTPPMERAAEGVATLRRDHRYRTRFWLSLCAVGAVTIASFLLLPRLWEPSGIARRPPPSGRIMLGVLPFDNYTGDPEQQYFVGGLTEEVIAQLGRLNPERLGVIARTSTAAFGASARPIAQMGEELGIDYAVEGSVRRENDRVRITVQVIDVRDRTHTWAENYEQQLSGILELQTEIAGFIARSLALKLLDDGAPQVGVAKTTNAAAYEAYLKGRYFREQITERGFRKGIEYFERAISEDSRYARAYSGLAGCYCLLGGHGMEVERPSHVLPRAKEAARRALELDDSLAEAHGVLGMIALKFDWDLEEAQRRFRRATELNPSYAQGFLWYSLYYEVIGQSGEAIAQATRARDLDPLSLAANVNLAQQYHRAGRHDEAAEQLEKALELSPNFWAAHWVLGDVHERRGSYQEAIAALSKAVLFSDKNPAPLGSLGFVYGLAGQPGPALEVLADLEKLADERYVSPFNMAIVHLGLGDKEEALEQLEKGYRERSRSMIWLKVDARLRPLNDDPRFQNLLKLLGFST